MERKVRRSVAFQTLSRVRKCTAMRTFMVKERRALIVSSVELSCCWASFFGRPKKVEPRLRVRSIDRVRGLSIGRNAESDVTPLALPMENVRVMLVYTIGAMVRWMVRHVSIRFLALSNCALTILVSIAETHCTEKHPGRCEQVIEAPINVSAEVQPWPVGMRVILKG